MRLSALVLPLALAVPVVAGADEPKAPAAPAAQKKDKKDKPAPKVFTNDDLKDAGKGGGTVTFLEEPQASAGGDAGHPTTAAPETGTSSEGRASSETGPIGEGGSETGVQMTEQEWRTRAREYREVIRNGEAEVARLEAKLNALTNPQQQPQPIEALQPDPQRRLTKSDDRIQLETDLEAARTGLAEARRAYDDFLEEARRKGVPPGWVEER